MKEQKIFKDQHFMFLFGLSNNPAFNSKLGYSITTKKGS